MPVIRVLWVVKGLGPGGAETLLAASARAHDHERFRIECAYVLPHKDHLVGALEQAGVMTHCVSRSARDPWWPARLAALIRRGGWDVVHVHSPLPGSVARLAVRSLPSARRPRVVTTEHNSWGTFARPTRLVNRMTSRWDDDTFAVSEEARLSMTGPAAARAVALVHGIDVARAAAHAGERCAVRAELGIAGGDLVIGTVANFRPQKAYPNLLAAFRSLLDSGARARLVVVGQGPLEAETRRLADELGVGDSVVFTGFRPDAVRVMSAFDVFTLASSWEGLPVAVMEATALGLPIVATAVGGVAEALVDGIDAVLVPPGDPAALSAAWRRVLDDEALRRDLARAASARAEEFDASRAQRTIEAAYARAVPHAAEVPAVPGGSARQTTSRSGLDIRPASVEDEDAIAAVLQRSLGWTDDPRFMELFRWKHQQSPFGPSPTWVATDAGRVVGVRIFMRWEFRRGDEVLRAVRAVDTATDPAYQGRGLFTALTMHGLEAMRDEGVDFVFNTPNAQSRPGYLKMGWREVGTLPAAVRVRGAGALLHVVRSRVPAEHWSEPLGIGRPVEEWLDDADERLLRPAPAGPRELLTRTSAAYLRWRFSLPSLRYRVLEGDGGAVVVRARRRGSTMELVVGASPGLDRQQADALVAGALRTSGCDHALRLGAAEPRGGFLPLPGGGPVLTWREISSAGMPPLPSWHLTMSDIELF